MKILNNQKLSFKDVPLLGDDQVQYDTLSILKVILENSSYDASPSLIKAARLAGSLKEEDGKINIEDADFEFIKGLAAKYMPLLQKGLVFVEFYKQLEI